MIPSEGRKQQLTKQMLIAALLVIVLVAGGGAVWWFSHSQQAGSSFATVTEHTVSQTGQQKPIAGPAALADLPQNARADLYAERIHRLGRDLSAAQQRLLGEWIRGNKPEHLDDGSWHWLVNDVMDALCRQKEPMSGMSDAFILMSTDPKMDIVLREYAIQHLVDRLQPLNSGEAFERDAKKRQMILSTIMDAAREQSGNLAGTATLALNNILHRQEQSVLSKEQISAPLKPEELQSLVINVASSPAISIPSKITALQICAERGFRNSLPVARKLASDEKEAVSIRLSAIALLGSLGTSEDVFLMESLRSGVNPRLTRAIDPALEKLSGKVNRTHDNASTGTALLSSP